MAIGLTLASAVTFDRHFSAAPDSDAAMVAGLEPVPGGTVPGGTVRQSVTRLQRHLSAQPRDATAWAALGLAYVEQARVTADPSYYPKAEGALDRSLSVRPGDNAAALGGKAALAAARHDFPFALRLAGEALAIDAYGLTAHAVRVDALVELGRYQDAHDAVRRADSLRPGIPIFTRYAYVLELRGRSGAARQVLERAARSADDPGDIAYVATQLGELAWNRGDHRAAGRHYAAALRADPSYAPALDGRARARAAGGDVDGAVRDRVALVGRVPLPSYVVALGELYEAHGRRGEARRQYAVAGTWGTLAKANGVAADLETALVAADHGDRAEALRAAQAEWRRRCGPPETAGRCAVHVADALAWALHVNGRDREALGYARLATGTGYRNALFLYHRGMIEKALGEGAQARRSLRAALRLNPHFSDLHAPTAREALR
ncbi:hypothetical protein HKK74_25500 [Actinomadura alba]|uniref:Tetratricopeptide repeat protein n=1 Tax=Actinomadura alba TaxID=406431 RepID=A0ABR7LWN0_9ACTN|nr:hypothetical protein [Actinomadura alba]